MSSDMGMATPPAPPNMASERASSASPPRAILPAPFSPAGFSVQFLSRCLPAQNLHRRMPSFHTVGGVYSLSPSRFGGGCLAERRGSGLREPSRLISDEPSSASLPIASNSSVL